MMPNSRNWAMQKSESQSYLDLCIDNDFWGLLPDLKDRKRIVLEEKALDSFGNLVHGLLGKHNSIFLLSEILSGMFSAGIFGNFCA